MQKFKQTIWKFYKGNRRKLPWRETRDPYKILVSEIMLQQTQALRVVPKYNSFLKKFPNTKILAKAKLSDVLKEWQGLGYNRRALYLKKTAAIIEKDFNGKFPKDFKLLTSLPGIGPATAGDILAFAWNIPSVLIETNIRSVFIHFFFKGAKANTYVEGNPSTKDSSDLVSDKEIMPYIEQTLDKENPREWYWALFDYGAHLKETHNPSRKSKHHVKQTIFKGSHREKRSKVLKLILKKPQTELGILKIEKYPKETLAKILLDLQKEGMIKKVGNSFTIK